MGMWDLCTILDKMLDIVGQGVDEEEGRGGLPVVSSKSHYVDVPHVQQIYNWDCGLACVSMVLITLGIGHHDIHYLAELCCTRSIWTVDLAYLLHRFSVKFSFLTVTLGANPDFSAETFYSEQLEGDLGRVDRLFENALETGIRIKCRSIDGEEISALISSGQYIAVTLVNKIKLSQSWQDLCGSGYYSQRSDYMGHYVVVCGYDANTNEFEIRDPASPRKYERVSMECLDEARKSFGTDEDILLVSLNERNGMNANKLSNKLLA